MTNNENIASICALHRLFILQLVYKAAIIMSAAEKNKWVVYAIYIKVSRFMQLNFTLIILLINIQYV